MNNILFLGGSPCCGKSTITEKIKEKYDFYYYKVDDYIEKYIARGADDGNEWLKHISSMSLNEL